MKIILVLFILSLTYYAESKWDKHYNGRDNHNSVEDFGLNNEINQYVHTRENQHKYNSKHDERPHRKLNFNPTNYHQRFVAGPPDHKDLIPMARYVMHNVDWASISTISTLPGIEGFPFNNVASLVDGYIANSTGVPYFYMSPLDFTPRDLTRDRRVTILTTLAETSYCLKKKYDAEDPRCTRLILSGMIKRVRENTTEYDFAKGALFERHPDMASYPADHKFFVSKLKIAQIAIIDWFGGANYIPVRDYLAYNYTLNDINLKTSV